MSPKPNYQDKIIIKKYFLTDGVQDKPIPCCLTGLAPWIGVFTEWRATNKGPSDDAQKDQVAK